MISSMLRFDSHRLTPTPQKTQNINYRELYLECKKNVAVFMKQVDTQISIILKNHQEEKKKLISEINDLKMQLHTSRNDLTAVMKDNSSYKSIPTKKYSSQIKDRNNTSVSKESVQECLAKFSRFDTKTNISQKKGSIEGSMLDELKQRKKSVLKTYYQEKENNFGTNQLNKNEQIVDLKIEPLRLVSNNLPTRREKRVKQKKGAENNEKAQNIKDILKNIRGNFNSQGKSKYFSSKFQEEQRSTPNVITPDMFNTSRSIKN